MRYLLDTNAVIALLRRNQAVELRARRHRPGDFGLSSIVAYELFFGAYKSAGRSENLARLDGLPFSILDFDAVDARSAGGVRALLEGSGQPIGPYDILIAGQALARGLILVTRNVNEFERVEGLRVENWER